MCLIGLLLILLLVLYSVAGNTLVLLEHQCAAGSEMTAPSWAGGRKAEQKKTNKKRKQMQERSRFSLSLRRLCLVASQHGSEYGGNIFAAAHRGRPFALFGVGVNARQEPEDDTVEGPRSASSAAEGKNCDLRFHLSASQQRSGALWGVYHHGEQTSLALRFTIKALMEGKQAGRPR